MLYRPPDVMAAHEAWGANCGPGALAAILRVPVMGLRPLFPQTWTTPTVMRQALTERLGPHSFLVHSQPGRPLPPQALRGLAFIQLRGTWDSAPVPAQYQRTHWVAFDRQADPPRLLIYDVNAGTDSDRGSWQDSSAWKASTLREICAQTRGASGAWFIRTVLEVRTS